MNARQVRLVRRRATPAEYLALRRAVGWRDIPVDVVRRALANDLHHVCAEVDGRLVGFGRVVGDGALCFFVEDLMVVPDLQGQGIGAQLMDAIAIWLDEHVPKGRMVNLMAAPGTVPFYARYGFHERPADAPGMFRRWGAPDDASPI